MYSTCNNKQSNNSYSHYYYCAIIIISLYCNIILKFLASFRYYTIAQRSWVVALAVAIKRLLHTQSPSVIFNET